MDDDLVIQSVTSEILKLLGNEVDLADCGETAIDLFKKAFEGGSRYDLVIMDLTVPGKMGGEETLPELKKIDTAFKAVVTSGRADDPNLVDYKAKGWDAVLIKPFDLNSLQNLMNNVSQ